MLDMKVPISWAENINGCLASRRERIWWVSRRARSKGNLERLRKLWGSTLVLAYTSL